MWGSQDDVDIQTVGVGGEYPAIVCGQASSGVQPSTDNRRSAGKEPKEIMMVTLGGDVEADSLLEQKRVSSSKHFEGGRSTHSAGTITPAASGVGCGGSTPKRKFSKLFHYDFHQVVIPTGSAVRNDTGASESPSKKIRLVNCSTGR